MNDRNESKQSADDHCIDVEARHNAAGSGPDQKLPIKALLAGLEPSPSVKAMHAALEPSRSIKAMLAAIEPSPAIKAMRAALEPSPAIKAMRAAIEPSPALKAMRTALEPSPALKAMLAAIEPSPAIKALLDGIQDFTNTPSMRALAGSDSSLAPGNWGLSSSTTLNEIFQEFVARATEPEEHSAESSDQPPFEAESVSSLNISDYAYLELAPAKTPAPPIKQVPTWVLVVWMWFVCPSLFIVINWDSARAGLADLNARLPQTETLAAARQFIRKELAGKPGNFRIVTGANVHLRVGPGMKHEVLLHLPKESIVVVLGKENRTWMYVSYEHQGFMIDGYVSSTYLKKAN